MEKKKINFDEFNILCQNGQVYNGFVESVGYVHWTAKFVYFVEIDPLSAKKTFREISAIEQWKYKRMGFKVVSKTQHILHVIPLDVLEIQNRQLYNDYYNGVPPLKNDAIKAPKKTTSPPSNGSSDILDMISNEAKKLSTISKPLEAVDDAIGVPLDFLGKVAGGKKIPIIGNILAGATIISNIGDGEYLSAAGETVKVFSGWYGLAFDVGLGIYGSDRFIIDNYWQTLNDLNIRKKNYKKNGSNSNYRQMEDAKNNHTRAEQSFRELMKQKYGNNWQKHAF